MATFLRGGTGIIPFRVFPANTKLRKVSGKFSKSNKKPNKKKKSLSYVLVKQIIQEIYYIKIYTFLIFSQLLERLEINKPYYYARFNMPHLLKKHRQRYTYIKHKYTPDIRITLSSRMRCHDNGLQTIDMSLYLCKFQQ